MPPSPLAVIQAHRRLNVDTGFIPQLTDAERQRVVDLAGTVDVGLPDPGLTLCSKMRRSPYLCEPLGEPAGDPVNGRDLAAAVFAKVSKDPEARAKFCAWQLMHLPKNNDKLYLGEPAARAQLLEWGAADAVSMLVPHGRREAAVTTVDLHCKQMAINRLWRDAAAVVPAGREDGDLGGLDDVQAAGVRKILGAPASLLVGVGGAGKSFCVSKIIACARSRGVEVVCLAPTHKAKFNIASAVPEDTTVATVQSYTQTLKRGGAPDELLIIVDESSMLDVDTLGDLALAVVEGVRRWQICLVGDEAQLDPVGRGECFRLAVRQAGPDRVVRLTRCYRAAFSKMFDFHSAVRTGTLPAGDGEVATVRKYGNDFEVMSAAQDVVDAEGADVTYIAWRNRDVDAINLMAQKKATGAPRPGTAFNVGDAVIYVGENKPRDNLTNAMCGRVASVHRYSVDVGWDESCPDGACATVNARDLRLAYCLTVHKAQGSGFARVCVVCTSSASMLSALDRRWLYTAVSRAQSEVVVLCTSAAERLAAKEPPAPPLSALTFRPAK